MLKPHHPHHLHDWTLIWVFWAPSCPGLLHKTLTSWVVILWTRITSRSQPPPPPTRQTLRGGWNASNNYILKLTSRHWYLKLKMPVDKKMRQDIQQMAIRIDELETEHDSTCRYLSHLHPLLSAQTSCHHLEDLDNRKCRNNIQVRELPGASGEEIAMGIPPPLPRTRVSGLFSAFLTLYLCLGIGWLSCLYFSALYTYPYFIWKCVPLSPSLLCPSYPLFFFLLKIQWPSSNKTWLNVLHWM